MPMPADYLVVHEGLYISIDALERIREVGPEARWHDAKLIEEAIKTRLCVYKGLKRDGYEEATCIICLPQYRYDNSGEKTSRPSNRLFLVYSTVQMYGQVVFDWEWKPGNEKTGDLYEGNDNFGEKTWPTEL